MSETSCILKNEASCDCHKFYRLIAALCSYNSMIYEYGPPLRQLREYTEWFYPWIIGQANPMKNIYYKLVC